MAVVYLYVPVEKAEVIVECGLKLSEWKNKNVQTPWSSFPQPCICALLHPDDDKRSKDSAFQCIKLDIPAEDCIIADKDLYNLSLESPDIKQKYIDTMVTLDKYIFGSFRNPECLIFTTIISEQIHLYGKGLDDPILYESSETLYVNNILEGFNERYSGINKVLLYCFMLTQSQNQLIEGVQYDNKGIAFFFDKASNKYITLPVPDLKEYKIDLD